MSARRARDRKIAKHWLRIERAAYVEDMVREFFADCDRAWDKMMDGLPEIWPLSRFPKIDGSPGSEPSGAFAAGDLSGANDVQIIPARPVALSLDGIRAMLALYR